MTKLEKINTALVFTALVLFAIIMFTLINTPPGKPTVIYVPQKEIKSPQRSYRIILDWDSTKQLDSVWIYNLDGEVKYFPNKTPQYIKP